MATLLQIDASARITRSLGVKCAKMIKTRLWMSTFLGSSRMLNAGKLQPKAGILSRTFRLYPLSNQRLCCQSLSIGIKSEAVLRLSP